MKKSRKLKLLTNRMFLLLIGGLFFFVGIWKGTSAQASGILFTKEIIDAGRVSKNGNMYSCTALCTNYSKVLCLKKLEYQTEEELYGTLDRMEYDGRQYALCYGHELYRMKIVGRNIELGYVPYDDFSGKTSVTINYIEEGSLNTIMSKTIDNLDVGTSYEFTPEERFVYNDIEYIQPSGKTYNPIRFDYLWTWPQNNQINLYYKRTDIIDAYGGGVGHFRVVCVNAMTDEIICSMTQDAHWIKEYRYVNTNRITYGQEEYMREAKRTGSDEDLHEEELKNDYIVLYYVPCTNLTTGTSVTIQCLDADTGQIIKTETKENETILERFEYAPVQAFMKNNKSYAFLADDKRNSLYMPYLWTNPENNVLSAYYKGTIIVNDLSDSHMEISSISDTVYNGKKQQPAVTVTCNGSTLEKDKDYRLSYKNSRNVGYATAVLTGIGDYTGSKSISFAIKPKAPSIKKLKRYKTSSCKITLSKVKGGISGYEISLSTNSKFKNAKTKKISKTSCIWKNLKNGKTYYIKARAYKKIGKKKLYSEYGKGKKLRIKKKLPVLL